MTESVLLVDFENVRQIDLESIPEQVRISFFMSRAQKSVPTELFTGATKLGGRLEPVRIEGHGKNALDFHIAFYLGECLARSPKTACIILSKDKGFDPLIKHLVLRGFAVRRAACLAEAFPGSLASIACEDAYRASSERAVQWLSAIPSRQRPKKRQALVSYLSTGFAKKLSEREIQACVDRLIAAGKVSEVGGAITYQLE